MTDERNFVGYCRVSTDKQGRSGLGLDAQRNEINSFLKGETWRLLDTYIEVESGKRDDRTELQRALETCKRTGSTLLIAKLDRLSRDVAFIANLMKSGVKFVACNMPFADNLTVHILAAVAEKEREFISERTKSALQAAKARGVKLGRNNLTPEVARRGLCAAQEARQRKADEFATRMRPMITGLRNQGLSLNEIGRQLNTMGILTASGRSGVWTPTGVRNLLRRSTR